MALQRFCRPAAAVAFGATLCVALIACSSNNNSNKRNAASNPAGTPAAAAARGTAAPSTANRGFTKAPDFSIDKNKGYIADVKTAKGDVFIQLNAQAAPLTVNNFVFLARQHFYDGLTCHRVVPDFVVQCGDPKGDGSGGPGYTIPDEPSPLKHDTGAVAMAKSSQPNSAGSQFYITLAPEHQLDGQYTVLGQVTQGMEVVKQIQVGDRLVSVTIQETDVTPTPVPSPAATPAR